MYDLTEYRIEQAWIWRLQNQSDGIRYDFIDWICRDFAGLRDRAQWKQIWFAFHYGYRKVFA